ncbi:TPA: phage repressor protein [Mannheimia haemolytica]|nr:phage repressor protein [Mannheimia haemolytica]HDZ6813886.1 phage repressor protein [Mannheimia haemolytica]
MTTQISTFNFKSHQVRIETINNEPYFALKDVCLALAIQVASPERFSLDPQGVTLNVIPTTSGNQELTFINEPNLYRIIFKSRKAEAIEFQNWVFEEVLPQIRKTGQYLQTSARIQPLVAERTFTHEIKNSDAVDIAWLWFEAKAMADFIKTVTPALEAIHSGYAPQAHSMGVEYGNHIHHLGKLIYRLTAEADFGHNPTPMKKLSATITPKKSVAKF